MKLGKTSVVLCILCMVDHWFAVADRGHAVYQRKEPEATQLLSGSEKPLAERHMDELVLRGEVVT
jgi:hypothetical protein